MIQEDGNPVEASAPNSIKFEMFVFDALPFAKNPIVVETRREDEFSPVKNGEGVDSPQTCREDQLRQVTRWLNATGIALETDETGLPAIAIEVSPLFGYDEDTVDSFDRAVEFAIGKKFCLANFNPLTPTPKAPLLDRLRRENRLVYDKWWLEPDYRYGQATFHPRRMTADELTAGCYRARTQFNRYGSIFRRAFDRRTNLSSPYRFGVYLLSNLISRREIHAKQNATLGGLAPLEPRTDKLKPVTVGSDQECQRENRRGFPWPADESAN